MSIRIYALISAIFFAVVAVAHLARIVWQWNVTVDSYLVPMWMSVVGIVVAGVLSFLGFRVVYQIRKYLS